jgi:cbb3-type cytochrome oxidase subunit 3
MSWLPVTSICFLGIIVFAAWCSKRRAERIANEERQNDENQSSGRSGL